MAPHKFNADTNVNWTNRTTGFGHFIAFLAIGLLAGQPTTLAGEPEKPPVPAEFAPAPMDLCAETGDGSLSGRLFGALSENIEWHGGNMECGGMLRPDDGGVRLVFAAPWQSERLLIVLGIDGRLGELPGSEHSANVTIVDESRNRFFSNGRRDRCWSTIESIRPVDDGNGRILQVIGEVYCAGSLPSLSDKSSVVLRNFSFSGRLLIDDPDES